MQLPPIEGFKETLQSLNVRRLYEYLAYFLPFQSNKGRNNSSERVLVFERVLQVLTDGSEEVQIISVQRLIMGMMMLGHAHIFELLKKYIFPYFLEEIQEARENRTFLESQLTKFGESELSRPSQIQNIEQHKLKIKKKLLQFYKESFLTLAQWFPRDFYNQNEISWFKEVVEKYGIRCRFIVYFTLKKIHELDIMIKQLKIQEIQCQQCKAICFQITNNVPSAIQEEEEEFSQGKIDLQRRKKAEKIKELIKKRRKQKHEEKLEGNNSSTCLKRQRNNVLALSLRKKMNISRQNSEKTLKMVPSMEDKNRLILEHPNYQSLGHSSKRQFLKKCFQRKQKVMDYCSEGVRVEIRSTLMNSYLSIQLNCFTEYSSKSVVKPLQPKRLLLSSEQNRYLFDFSSEFEPIVMKINGRSLILPILSLELLQQCSRDIVFERELELQFKVNWEIFKNLRSVAMNLGMNEVYKEVYEHSYMFMGNVIMLRLSRKKDGCRLQGKCEKNHGKKLQLLVEELKRCLKR